MAHHLRRALLVVALTAPLLAGCSDDDSGATDDSSSGTGAASGTTLRVVTTTNVWGDVAQVVGGNAVEVTSFITDPSQDPHSYEANPKTVLAVQKADLLVENGGGYDDWMDKIIEAADSDAPVINAVEVSGKQAAAGGELNEHVWYDLPTAAAMADRMAEELAELDPGAASRFRANADAFDSQVDALVRDEKHDAATLTGTEIGITEPVPLYMTEALGLTNRTPPAFSEAVEEGDDVPVPVLAATLDLYSGDPASRVSALVYNAQTSGPVTEKVEQAATDNGVAVVPVTETLPAGSTYLQWMRANLDAILTAVS